MTFRPDATPETWILNGILYSQNETREVRRGNIHIVEGRITEITASKPESISPAVNVIDAAGLTLIPGFVQAHVHLCQTLFRNQADDLELLDWLSKRIWLMEAAHTKETLHTSALLGIYELLSSGTTCILDMGTVRHTSAIFEAARETGIRASIGKCLMDHPTQTPESLREPTAEALREARALYDEWHGQENDRLRVSYAPRFAISCTDELMREVAKISREEGALVHTHASENLKEIEMVRKQTGLENIQYFESIGLTSPRLVLAHCVWLNAVEKDILRRTGTHVTHCPSSNLKLASGFARIPELLARGVNVALGADGAPCNNNLNMFQEMRLAALMHKPTSGPQSMKAMDVLDMATRHGAKALSWFDDIGSIEVGKKADIVGLNLQSPLNTVPAADVLNPEAIASSIVYSCQPAHVKWTLVDGRIVYQDGQVAAISENDLMPRVRKAQALIAAALTK
jgi:5-methylthioadenosine/S-adenosylhomocysteine deaminase